MPAHQQDLSKFSTEANKKIALHALTGVFVDRDPSVVDQYFAPDYVQHNPSIPNGPAAIKELIPKLPKDFSYQPGMAVAEGNLVMVHGRVVGWGPKPMVVVDIFRLKEGKVAEHWDVLQEEVPASASASGNPMFSSSEAK
ncbi:nuclear transport factor 2 family protein [Pseudomonas yamanorum]|nr:nuclear transport factor 2 family protein [Pseudomonas yamanorum]